LQDQIRTLTRQLTEAHRKEARRRVVPPSVVLREPSTVVAETTRPVINTANGPLVAVVIEDVDVPPANDEHADDPMET